MTDRSDTLGGRTASRAEQIGWQRQAHALIGRLLELAAKKDLPAITWTVQEAGASVHGETLAHPDTLRREHFAAWKAAVTELATRAPDHAWEHTSGSGETRLLASWEHLPVRPGQRYPTAGVAIVASVWADEDDEPEPGQ